MTDNINTSEKKLSVMFSIAKTFALLSIISAHIMMSGGELSMGIWRIYRMLGTVGVICFLFISAYYYKSEKFGSVWTLVKNKALGIGVPWLVLGSVTYAYKLVISVIKGQSIGGVASYFNWIIGNGSYLYYMTVLFLCYLIFYKTNRYVLFGAIGVNLVSLVLTASGVLNPVVELLHIDHYLNIFNWVGVFALGMLFKNVNKDKLYSWIIKLRYIAILAFIVANVVLFIFNVEVTYFSYAGIWYELIGMLAVFGASTFGVLQNKLFMDISNTSFTIYLLHTIIIGLLDRVCNIHFTTQIVSAFIILIPTYLCVVLVRVIAKKIKLERLTNIVLGIRGRSL